MRGAPVYFSAPAVVCAAGNSADELWESAVSGSQRGIVRVRAQNGKNFFAGKVADESLGPSSARYDMRILRIEEAALRQLENDIAAARTKYAAERIGVCVGSCDNGTEFSVAGHRRYFETGVFPDGYSLEIQGADYVSAFVAEKYGLKGPALSFSTACSSGACAIIKAAELIRAGICDAVIAGGADIASDTVLLGFDSLEAVSPEISNPFSRNRRGITLGEAAAFFVMAKEPPASCKENIRLLGYGESADAYHMTSPEPSGGAAAEAMRRALASAELTAGDIDYINLHGTGTRFNDSMEAKAVDAVFGAAAVPVSATKPLTGHTLGAAGALEAALCYTVVAGNSGRKPEEIRLPVQVWDREQDPALPVLNVVNAGEANRGFRRADICMSNSFAFGGANASLIIGRPQAS